MSNAIKELYPTSSKPRFKVDLHTHSEASYDGGISLKQYRKIIQSGKLDFIAITDHGQIDFAKKAQQTLGNMIIVGQEIMTLSGEVIGLFLNTKIMDGLPLETTIKAIKSQEALVYIPHPLDKLRHGIGNQNLLKILSDIDILEYFNGREVIQNHQKLKNFCEYHHIAYAASSDAHGYFGLGRAYSTVTEKPNSNNLKTLISSATYITNRSKLVSYLYPSYNKIKRKVWK